MNSSELKRSRELSAAVHELSKGYTQPKKVAEKPKDLDFLNKLTGLTIPKHKLRPIIPKAKKDVQVVEKKLFFGKPGERGPKGDSIQGEQGRPGRDGSRFLGTFSNENELPEQESCVQGDFAIVNGTIWYIV